MFAMYIYNYVLARIKDKQSIYRTIITCDGLVMKVPLIDKMTVTKHAAHYSYYTIPFVDINYFPYMPQQNILAANKKNTQQSTHIAAA